MTQIYLIAVFSIARQMYGSNFQTVIIPLKSERFGCHVTSILGDSAIYVYMNEILSFK